MAFFRFLFALCVAVLLIHEAEGQCGGSTLTLPGGSDLINAQSFSVGSPHTHNMVCEWLLTASTGYEVFLSIDTIYLEWGYDFLYVYDGNSVSGTRLFYSLYNRVPTVILSTGQDLFVRFTSDYSIAYNGFTASFVAVERTNLPACNGQITATPTETQFSYVASQGSACTFQINAAANNFVQYRVPVAEYSQFQVSDGGTIQVLDSGTSIYVSTGTSIQVYATDTQQFVMNYKEVANTTTANIVTSPTTTDYSICSISAYRLVATATPQYITSPNYPASYSNNVYCSVTIATNSVDAAVELEFTDWDVDYPDFLYIYDGSTASYNDQGTVWPTGSIVNSTGTSLYLVFNSDSIGNLRGFRAKFIAVSRVLPSCASAYTSYNASSSISNITSPGYPSFYSNDMDEYWLIEKSSESDNLVLDITFMDIEEAYDCVYDKLTLYDGACTTDPVLAAVCGSTPVTFEDSTGLYILVRFTTDGSVVRTGFYLQYYIGAFTDDDDSFEIKDWIIPLVVLLVVLAILTAAIIFVVIYRYRSLRQVGAHKTGPMPQPRPMIAKKLTTHQLLHQFKTQIKQKQLDRKQKYALEPPPEHMPPNPPGPDTTIINRGNITPHPPPIPSVDDPVYPPNIFDDSTAPAVPIAPVLPAGQTVQPSAPEVKPIQDTSGVIPPPFHYITPAEARAAREANQAR